MKLKLVELEGKTYAEVQDGKPVYLGEDGKETAFDAPNTVQTISRLNAEAKSHREAKEAAEKALKRFDGIDDPEAAIKALATVKNLDDKKLVDAGEVEKVKAEAIKAVEDKYKPTVEKAEALEKALRQEKIGGQFARSKFISEKLVKAMSPDVVESIFGRNFELKDGKVYAKDANGNEIYSKSNPGEPAGFDEALEILVSNHPNRDHWLAAKAAQGGDVKGDGPGGGGGKTIPRAQFNKMSPDEQRRVVMEDKATVVD